MTKGELVEALKNYPDSTHIEGVLATPSSGGILIENFKVAACKGRPGPRMELILDGRWEQRLGHREEELGVYLQGLRTFEGAAPPPTPKVPEKLTGCPGCGGLSCDERCKGALALKNPHLTNRP